MKHKPNKKNSGNDDASSKVYLDMTDKSLLDFKKAKSISIASKISDIKSSKIGELYDVKPIHDNMHRLCLIKVQGKASKETPIPKKISKEICECLFEKNKDLSIAELEKRVSTRLDTPASQCITILDNYLEKNANTTSKKSSKHSTSSRTSSRKSKHKHSRKHSSKYSKKSKGK
jgi:hypothetical protein